MKVKYVKAKYACSDEQLTKKHEQDAGLDVYSAEYVRIPAGQSDLISTGLYVQIPENHVGLLWSRSGLAVKHDIEVGAGCVDASYRGEVKVLLRNLGQESYIVECGARIAQLLTIPCYMGYYERVSELDPTDRNDGGFGSTGV